MKYLVLQEGGKLSLGDLFWQYVMSSHITFDYKLNTRDIVLSHVEIRDSL